MTEDDLYGFVGVFECIDYTDYQNHVLSYLSNPQKDDDDPHPHPEYYVCATPPPNPEPDIPDKSKPIVPDNYLSGLLSKLRCKAAAISPYDLLDKLGLDKSQLKRLLKENYGISLDNKDLMKCKTVEALESLIKIAAQRNKKRNEQQNQH